MDSSPLAVLLACIGLYGGAYRVARRTRKIGIRIAIGARQQSVVWMMVRETLLSDEPVTCDLCGCHPGLAR